MISARFTYVTAGTSPHSRYYGWETHELHHPISDWRGQMRRLIASFDGSVVDHGRVGQPELLAAKARAQLHYYVCDFPEVDCIAVRASSCCYPAATLLLPCCYPAATLLHAARQTLG